MKKAAIRYGISYIVMWAILGIVILGMPPDANLTQAGLMKGVVTFHVALAMTAAMEALARAVWSRMRNLRQHRGQEESTG